MRNFSNLLILTQLDINFNVETRNKNDFKFQPNVQEQLGPFLTKKKFLQGWQKKSTSKVERFRKVSCSLARLSRNTDPENLFGFWERRCSKNYQVLWEKLQTTTFPRRKKTISQKTTSEATWYNFLPYKRRQSQVNLQIICKLFIFETVCDVRQVSKRSF